MCLGRDVQYVTEKLLTRPPTHVDLGRNTWNSEDTVMLMLPDIVEDVATNCHLDVRNKSIRIMQLSPRPPAHPRVHNHVNIVKLYW